MTLKVCLAGATGWVGRALVAAVAQAGDLALVGAVARQAAGSDAGEAAGIGRLGVKISATLAEALATPCDVVIDYTKPTQAMGATVVQAEARLRHEVTAPWAESPIVAGFAERGEETVSMVLVKKEKGGWSPAY